MLAWNDILTLTRLEVAKLNLLLLVGELGRVLAEQHIQPPLVCSIGDDDQDWEEHECEHGFPDLDQVFGNEDKDHQKPDVGQNGEQGGDAKHRELLDPEIIKLVKKQQILLRTNLLVSPSGMPEMQTAEMASRLNEAEPTIVLGPRASASKLLPTIPIIANRISGADEPKRKICCNHFY